MPKYTDKQIEEACINCVDTWDMDTLLQFAIDEMYHHYTVVASAEGLDDFMADMSN